MRPLAQAALLTRLALDPVRAHDRLAQQNGFVVTLGAGPLKVTYLLGAEANHFVFANPDLFTWRTAYESLTVISGETALLLSDGPDHRRRHGVVAPTLAPRRVHVYRDVIEDHAHRVIDTWEAGQTVDLYAEFRTAIRASTIEALFGVRLAGHESAFARHLQASLDLADNDPWRLGLRRAVQSPAWRRAVAGRRQVADLVLAEIKERSTNAAGNDLLTELITAEQASRLSTDEVVDQVISLIAAGYETTSAAFGWVCHRLLTDGGAGAAATHIVAEVLRLYPPAVVVARRAARAFRYDGIDIPAGRLVLISPYVTHRSAQVWTDPLRFDAERWNPDFADHCRPRREEYFPFGAGLHHCVGTWLAQLTLTAMLDVLRQRAQLSRVGTSAPRGVNVAAMRPAGGTVAVVESVRARR